MYSHSTANVEMDSIIVDLFLFQFIGNILGPCVPAGGLPKLQNVLN